MRKALGILLVVTVASGIAVGLSRVPEALAKVEFFRVTDFRVEGARYLTEIEAIATVALPEDYSVWDDLDLLESNLRKHPLVLEAKVRRKLPETLVLHVKEREPVALIPMPALVPVDDRGRELPIDPSLHKLDLPLIQPFRSSGMATPLTPAQIRVLAEEIARLGHVDPDFVMSISEIAFDERGDVVVRLGDAAVEMLFKPPLAPQRLQEGLLVLSDAIERRPRSIVRAVDLRYADQVVVRFSQNTGRN